MAIKFDQLVAIEQPQQPGMIDPAEGPLAVAAEQVEGSPAEPRDFLAPSGIEELADVVNELLPALRRNITGRAIGIEPGEALGPCARDLAVVLDYRGAFFLGLAPARENRASRLPDRGCCLERLARFPGDGIRSEE